MAAGVAMGEACTIVLRGATQQILDEAERSLHDALCVLQQTVKETRTVYGGGTRVHRNFYKLTVIAHEIKIHDNMLPILKSCIMHSILNLRINNCACDYTYLETVGYTV